MSDEQLLERITLKPKVMAGKPVIKGTRLSVEYILNLLAHGATVEEILDEYKGITQEDVRACLPQIVRSFGLLHFDITQFMILLAYDTDRLQQDYYHRT